MHSASCKDAHCALDQVASLLIVATDFVGKIALCRGHLLLAGGEIPSLPKPARCTTTCAEDSDRETTVHTAMHVTQGTLCQVRPSHSAERSCRFHLHRPSRWWTLQAAEQQQQISTVSMQLPQVWRAACPQHTDPCLDDCSISSLSLEAKDIT